MGVLQAYAKDKNLYSALVKASRTLFDGHKHSVIASKRIREACYTKKQHAINEYSCCSFVLEVNWYLHNYVVGLHGFRCEEHPDCAIVEHYYFKRSLYDKAYCYYSY
jgi:hypothetical protein